MSDGRVILTKEQWDELFDGLDIIRDRFDGLLKVAEALSVCGIDVPAYAITSAEDDIAQKIASLQATLMIAEDAPPPRKVRFRLFGFWLIGGPKSQSVNAEMGEGR